MIQTECDRFFKEEMNLTQSTPGPKTVEIFKTMSSLIILTAARTLQGKEVRDSMDSRFAQLFHDLDGGFTPVNFLFPNLPLPSYRRRDKAQREMSDFYVNIMNKRDEGESEVRPRGYGVAMPSRIAHQEPLLCFTGRKVW